MGIPNLKKSVISIGCAGKVHGEASKGEVGAHLTSSTDMPMTTEDANVLTAKKVHT